MASPFDYEHADPWAHDFVDIESINAEVTEGLIARIEAVRAAAPKGSAELRSSSTLILGPAGSGKTHLFARLRKKCGLRAAFVLVRPEVGVLPTPRQILAQVVDALQKQAIDTDKRQIDAVVGALLAARGGPARWPLVALDDLRTSSDREERVEQILEHLEESYEDLAASASYVRRLLLLPFAARQDRQAMLQYLSGREPEEGQLKRLGLTRGLADEDVMPALRSLAVVAAFGAPIVILFDQLENLVSEDGERIHAHARVYSELFDPPMRGLVLVQMALDREWEDRIHPRLGEAERSRLESHTLSLALPTPEQRDALLREWTQRLGPEIEGGPFPFPFSAKAWQEWRSLPGVTPRMLMIESRERLAAGGAEPPAAPTREDQDAALIQRLEVQWEEHVTRTRAELDEAIEAQRALDESRLVSGIRAYLGLCEGIAIVKARPPSQLSARAGGRDVSVVVLQQENGKSLATTLKKCAALAKTQTTRVLRESRLAIKPTWKACVAARRALLAVPGVAWVELDRETTARLLTLHDFLASARSRDLTDAAGRPVEEARAAAWVRTELIASEAWSEMLGRLAGEGSNARAPMQQTALLETEPIVGKAPIRVVLAALRRLHLASLDRLVREVRLAAPGTSQVAVMSALDASPTQIVWLGRTIVCTVEVAS